MPDIRKVAGTDTAGVVEEVNRPKKNRKRSNKSEKDDVELAKVSNIQDELDH